MKRAAIVLLVLLGPSAAQAHDVRGEVIFLDFGDDTVGVEVQVPVLQLALARQRREADVLDGLAAEVPALLGATARDGRPYALAVDSAGIERVGDGAVVDIRATLTPPAGAGPRWLALKDELVLHRVMTDNIYVFVRRDVRGGNLDGSPILAGTMHYQARTLVVDRGDGGVLVGLGAAFRLGARHIAEGTDHLLFLLMLLLAARRVRRAVAIVTAFTVGHSLTLAIGAIHGPVLPTALVETAIAVSIALSAANAVVPLFRGREPLLAGAFGLIHGLAFASALAGFGARGASLVIVLAGFNVGVEAMQLAVVAVALPILLVVVARRAWLQRLLAVGGAIASLVWTAERAGPLVALLVAVALALVVAAHLGAVAAIGHRAPAAPARR